MKQEYEEVASAEVIEKQINRIAAEIISNYETTPLFVALLRGAAPFAARLMHAIAKQSPDFHPELDYMIVSTYGTGQQAGQPHTVTDIDPRTRVTGRDVVILDDVLDKGITAEFVANHLTTRGAISVKLAVLCEKRINRVTDISADFCGLSLEDGWLVGMGLDDANSANEGYRWLDSIMQVKQ